MFYKSQTLIMALTFFKCPFFLLLFLNTTETHLLCLMLWGFEVHCDLLVASFIVFFSLKQLYTLFCKRYIKNIYIFWCLVITKHTEIKWNSGKMLYMGKCLINVFCFFLKMWRFFEQSLGAEQHNHNTVHFK